MIEGFAKRDGPLELFYPRNANPVQLSTPFVSLTTYGSANVDTDYLVGNAAASTRRGQGIKIAATSYIGHIALWLKKVGSPTDDVQCQIFTDDGTGKPSGTQVGSTISRAGTDLDTAYVWVSFPFATTDADGPQLTGAVQYHIVVRRSGANDAANYYVWGGDASAPGYVDGAASVYNGANWAAVAADHAFNVYQSARWGWSAYSNIVAATVDSFVPHELNLVLQVLGKVDAGLAIWIEYELAIGAAPNEVNFFRYTDVVANYTVAPGVGTTNRFTFGRTLPVGPKEIPAGTRISQRIRASEPFTNTSVLVWAYLGGYAGGGVPLSYTPYVFRPYLAGVHRAKSDISTQGDSYARMTPANFPNYGNWVQVIDPAPADLIIYGLAYRQFTPSFGVGSFYVQIGTGAAGQEVPRRVMGIPRATMLGNVGMWKMRYPVFVKKGERVAICGTGYTVEQYVKLLWEAM